MRLSRFNIEIANPVTPDELLLYNTMEGSLVSVSVEGYNQFKKMIQRGSADQAADQVSLFSELGFLEPSREKMDKAVDAWFKHIRQNPTSLNVTVVTTLACNFSCPYCVQGASHPVVMMNEATCRRVVETVSRELAQHPVEELRITYYGGEPLLNINAVRYLQKAFRSLAERYGAEFGAHLITNGSLLSHFGKELKDLGIGSLKVTLDGTEACHNKTRCYSNGTGSFTDIIEGLHTVPASIAIQVGSNFCDDNYEAIRELPGYLAGLRIAGRIRQFYAKPVVSPREINACGEGRHACSVYTRKDIERSYILQEMTESYGLPTLAVSEQGPCIFYHERDVTVAPDGRLFPCPNFIYHVDECLGSVFDDRPLYERSASLHLGEQCRECEVLPMCGGGCRYASKLCFNETCFVNCEKEFLLTAIQREIQKQFKAAECEAAPA